MRDGILDDRHHRPLARRRRPQEVALGRMQPVQVARAPGVEELLVVVQIEAVEVGALPAVDLLDAQNLPAPHFQRLAGARLDDEFPTGFFAAPCLHRCPSQAGRQPARAWRRIRATRGEPGPSRLRASPARDGLVDQLELLLVQPQAYGLSCSCRSLGQEGASRAGREAPSLLYGVQPLGACIVVLLMESRFALVTGISAISSSFFGSGCALHQLVHQTIAVRPISTGCCATT